MEGIEKITARIEQDVQREIDGVLAQARAQADDITARYEAQAAKESEDILARGRKSAGERVERLYSVAQLEGKKRVLAVKQEMVGRAFDDALEQLLSLPEDRYVGLLVDLTLSAARTGREQVILSPKDRARIGKQVIAAANERLAKAVAPELPDALAESKAGALLDKVVSGASALLAGTGMLTLSEETRPIRGGVILVDGRVETNCSLETLVRLQREELASQVAQVLFDGVG